MNFKDNLHSLRKQKKVSQEVLAQHLGVSQRLISHYEKGKCEPSLDDLCKMANFFGVTLDTLVGFEAEKND